MTATGVARGSEHVHLELADKGKRQMVTVARPVKLTHKLTTMLHTAVHHHKDKGESAPTRAMSQLGKETDTHACWVLTIWEHGKSISL